MKDIKPYNLNVLDIKNSNDILYVKLIKNEVFYCGRLGTSESWGAVFQKIKEINPFFRYPEVVKIFLNINAGMFSDCYFGRHYYKKKLFKSVRHFDLSFCWNFPMANYILGRYGHNIVHLDFNASFINSVYDYDKPWTLGLKGKRVLVISSYSNTIEKQYKNIGKVFPNKQIVPQFTLITYQSVVSFANEKTPYKTWRSALKKMEKDISNIDFDVALLSCGSYGAPLGAYIKRKMNKTALYVGSGIQTLFGIKSKRSDEEASVNRFYNKYWVRVSDEETPKNYKLIEDGCYW